MMAVVSAMAARVGDSVIARWWRKAGDVLDCVIPIALAATLAIGWGSVLFGYAH